jgi:hypothetical protein
MGIPVTQDLSLQAGQAGQAVPANIAQVAAAAGLGSFQRAFVPKRLAAWRIILLVLFTLAFLIVAIGLLFLWMLVRSPNLNPSIAARRLYLYEYGFVLANKPDEPQVFRFDAINTVFQKIISRRQYGIETARTYLYTISSNDGRTVKLTQFWDEIADLGSYLNTRVSSALLPGAVAAVNAGHGVRFGDMTITRAGITGRRKSVSWAEVSDVAVANGYVSVKVAGKFFSLSTTAASAIPNLPLFLTLAEQMRGSR